MKRVIVSMVIGLFLFLGISSSAFCAQGGHYGGRGYYGGGHYGGRGYHGGGHYGGGGYYYRYGGPRVFIGGYFGLPYYPYGYYPYYYPYPYYPDTSTEPPVYSGLEQNYYWYYCKNPQGYYPYVTSCRDGWMKVIPTPPQPGEE